MMSKPPHLFLNCGSCNIPGGAMIPEIDDLDPMPDKLGINRKDCAVVTITDRDGR